MIQQQKTSIAKVSHYSHRHLSLKHSSIKKRRANTVIHVAIRLPKTVRSTNNNCHTISNRLCSQMSDLTKTSHEGFQIESSKQTGMTRDYHKKLEKKKNKCSHRYFIGSLLAILLVIVIVLLVLLIKPKRRITQDTEPVLRWNTTGITVAGINGSSGKTNIRLYFPFGIIMDYGNNLYIADYGNHRVQKYLFGSSFGETIAGNGTNSSSPYHLSNPSHIIIDANGDYYITDRTNHRIQFWRHGEIFGTTLAGTGSSGSAYNELRRPYGIALHPTLGTLYIADCDNSRLMSYASGAMNGTRLLGGSGLSNTQLLAPVGIHLDFYSNSLIIANYGAHNVVQYPLGGTSWTLLAGNISGFAGNTSTSFNYPLDVVVDPMGNMYVAERDNSRIQFFNGGQSIGSTIAGITGVTGSNATTFNLLSSLCLDSQLNLYVSDSGNHRIQKFLRY